MNAERILINTPRMRFKIMAKRNGWHCCWAHLTFGTKESGYTSAKLCSDLNWITVGVEFSPAHEDRPAATHLRLWPLVLTVI